MSWASRPANIQRCATRHLSGVAREPKVSVGNTRSFSLSTVSLRLVRQRPGHKERFCTCMSSIHCWQTPCRQLRRFEETLQDAAEALAKDPKCSMVRGRDFCFLHETSERDGSACETAVSAAAYSESKTTNCTWCTTNQNCIGRGILLEGHRPPRVLLGSRIQSRTRTTCRLVCPLCQALFYMGDFAAAKVTRFPACSFEDGCVAMPGHCLSGCV